MAAAPFGPGEREGAEERGDAAGKEEERGDARPHRGVAREAGGSRRWTGSRRWPGRVAARAGRVPVLLAGRKTTGEEVEMGWAGWAALEELGQVSGLR